MLVVGGAKAPVAACGCAMDGVLAVRGGASGVPPYHLVAPAGCMVKPLPVVPNGARAGWARHSKAMSKAVQ